MVTMSPQSQVSFDNIENAFAGKSTTDLNRAYFLFKAISSRVFVNLAEPLTKFALFFHLPIRQIVKATIFKQFVGGETIDDCDKTISRLYKQGVGSILDYSVEGQDNEESFENTTSEILRTIEKAKNNKQIPFCVFKPSGIARFEILYKLSSNTMLDVTDQREWERVVNRVNRICEAASANKVRVFIDAEESWIQNAIDMLAEEMMEKLNKEDAIIFNTVQLYRTDRLGYLKNLYARSQAKGYVPGLKLVRGAYMEKERRRAEECGYASPVHASKQATDSDYNQALVFCMDHISNMALCAGTHNERSCMLLAEQMDDKHLEKNYEHVWFSQLLGMSDHISFNLAKAGYNVCKYVPYGPVREVMPYLFRRARENTSVKGQTGRELSLIMKEKERRKMSFKLN